MTRHSTGTVIDCSYETLDAMARSGRPIRTAPLGEGVEEPSLCREPCSLNSVAPQAAEVAGRDVWLVHPWALGEPQADQPEGCVRVGLWPAEYHEAWPWSAARWAFVGERMAALTSMRWHADRESLTHALAGARSVHTLADPHVSSLLPRQVVQRAPLHLFSDVGHSCHSFSTWWNRTMRGVKSPGDLPGLKILDPLGTAGPLVDTFVIPCEGHLPSQSTR